MTGSGGFVPNSQPAAKLDLRGIRELLADSHFDQVGVLANDDARALVAEVLRLRQAIWDAYGALGFDQDGLSTPPGGTSTDLAELIVSAAKEHREDYDAACEEAADVIEDRNRIHGELLQARALLSGGGSRG